MNSLLDYNDLKKNLEILFEKNGITELADIDWIMVEVTGKQRSMLPFCGKFSLEETEKIMKIATERAKHKPLAYILGKAYFYGREFKVNENVLIPRQDTEILIDKVLGDLKNKNGQIVGLDIGTGSGAIAITLALESNAKMVAIDISEKALETAKFNSEKHKAGVEFLKSDILENVNAQFDFIVSNPPYIETSVVESLEEEVRANEPILALDGGIDGLDFYRKIIKEAPKFLKPKGKLYFEIGYNQAESVKNLMEKDFSSVAIFKDFGNNDRVVVGELK